MSVKKNKQTKMLKTGVVASLGLLVLSLGKPIIDISANQIVESSYPTAILETQTPSSRVTTSTILEESLIKSEELAVIESSTTSAAQATSETNETSLPQESSNQGATTSSSTLTSSTTNSTTPSTSQRTNQSTNQSTSQSKVPTSTAPEPNTSSTSNSVRETEKATTDQGKNSMIEDGTLSYSKNQSTEDFIEKIGKDASQIADQNDLYASVMIAQAILESASGNSSLARQPNYNLFGIKGSYEGASIGMPTLEDNGRGVMSIVTANFRKYPSYKQSLMDYARLIKGGSAATTSFYKGTWKSQTTNYREATLFLTGRYATDIRYNQKLNGLIETYELERFDHAKKINQTFKVTSHQMKADESLWDVSKKYGVTIGRMRELNKLEVTDSQLPTGFLVVVKREAYDPNKETESSPSLAATSNQESVDSQTLLTQKKLTKELAVEKEEKQLSLMKASQLGISLTNTLPAVLFESNTLKVMGQQVKGEKTHYVAKNETINSISKETGVSIESLVEWNNLEDSVLKEGQVLIIDSPLNSQY